MRFARLVPALAIGLLVAAACTTHPLGSRTSPTPSALASPHPVATIPVASPAPVISGGFDPARVVQVLESMQQSLDNGGSPITLDAVAAAR